MNNKLKTYLVKLYHINWFNKKYQMLKDTNVIHDFKIEENNQYDNLINLYVQPNQTIKEIDIKFEIKNK